MAQPMGLNWFIAGILLLMLVTYPLAVYISPVLEAIQGIPKLYRQFRDKREERKRQTRNNKREEEDGGKA